MKNWLPFVFVPAFAGWAWLLGRYAFTPAQAFLLYGISGTLAKQVSGGLQLGTFAGEKAPYSSTNLVDAALLNLPAIGTPTSGRYAVVFPSKAQTPTVDPALYPQGDGFSSLTLTNTGNVSLAGYLADGTKYAASGKLRADGTVPLFTQLYRKGGAFAGEFTFADLTDSDQDRVVEALRGILGS